MTKPKKKRQHDAMVAPSPNDVQNDAAICPPVQTPSDGASASATPPIQNDDSSTWTKSKKKRMRMKAKKEAAKKLLVDSGNNGGKGKKNGPKAKTTSPKQDSVSDNNASSGGKGNESSPNKQPTVSVKDDLDCNSKKRQRLSSPVPAANNAESVEMRQNSPKKKTKKKTKPSTPTASLHGDKEGDATKSLLKSASKSPKSKELAPASDNADSTSPKKNKKKKKNKKSAETTSEAIQTSPNKSNQKVKETENAIPDKSSSESSNTKSANPKLKITLPKPSKMSTLQKAFLERLTSSRFRELNEELYTHSSQHAFDHFTQNPELFDQYHVGFRKQAKEWPTNPVDVIYKKIVQGWNKNERDGKGEKTKNHKKSEKAVVVADFGCGDAKLAERLLALQLGKDGQINQNPAVKKKKNNKDQLQSSCPFKVHSFDLVSGGNHLVTPADMCNVPLQKDSVDIAVYSLALMGTNVADFVREAWRVLRFNGVLRVAEVRSRFETASADTPADKNAAGKRGKLNNGKKHHANNKNVRVNNKADNGDKEDAPQPLMLLDEFIALLERCGFQCTNMDRSNKMFLFMDFVKVDGSKGLAAKERFTAKPCIYKRR